MTSSSSQHAPPQRIILVNKRCILLFFLLWCFLVVIILTLVWFYKVTDSLSSFTFQTRTRTQFKSSSSKASKKYEPPQYDDDVQRAVARLGPYLEYWSYSHKEKVKWDGCQQIACNLNETRCTEEIVFPATVLLTEFFAEHNITYFLEGGALLGAVRSGKLIQDDKDVDMVISTKDMFRLLLPPLRSKLKQLGFHIFFDSDWTIARICLSPNSSFVPEDLKTDQPWWSNGRPRRNWDICPLGVHRRLRTLQWQNTDCHFTLEGKELFPLRDVFINGRPFSAMNRYEEFILYEYGPNWTTIDAPWSVESANCDVYQFGIKPPTRLVAYADLDDDDDDDDDDADDNGVTSDKKEKNVKTRLKEVEEDDDFSWSQDIERIYFRDREEDEDSY
eukprot:TRINITY_DN2901_c0_g3_i1.p1 TRINITY_DN2901_c0_g3~~TRINITY_DN2901_c0_g3_i1.p1  ORF type:complete len:389 (-),score=78.92 TRINITY_DN2901_c0_g3_i1:77-1243(-)